MFSSCRIIYSEPLIGESVFISQRSVFSSMNKIAKIVLISVGIGGASLLGGISLVNIGINIENEPAQPISPEELAEQSDIENKKDGLRAMKEGDFFSALVYFHAISDVVLCQEKVQIKYALLMLSYPAKASALSSNAA